MSDMSDMSNMSDTRRRAAGFTLLELMVGAIIICIFAALTLPSLQRYVVLSKRAQAQAMLLRLMQQQERYYSEHNHYLQFSADSTAPDERLFQWWSGERAVDSAYEIDGAACPDEPIARCVILTAQPGTSRVDSRFRDEECATLSLSSKGLRAASGPATHCWP
jgi:type IV pilus assembly protein PilE